MAIRHLFSERELEALRGFGEPTRQDLVRFFTLSVADVGFVGERRGNANRLGVGVQLCSLRWLGFVPDDVASAPAVIVERLAGQLGLSPSELAGYGDRPQTRTEQLVVPHPAHQRRRRVDHRVLQPSHRPPSSSRLTSSASQTGYHSGLRGGYERWSFERDATVSGEIVSPVLYDDPRIWDELAQVCEIVKRHGGKATARTGGHVHVGCGDYDHTVENHNRLLGLVGAHEDVLYRLSHNPHRRAHRGMAWCRPNQAPSSGYRTVDEVTRYQGNHGIGVNFGSVGGEASDHVEFRMWDGSLDPGVIQTQINLSLGLTEAAFGRDAPIGAREGVGTHRESNAVLARGERLSGSAWTEDTRSFRRLMDTVFWRQDNKRRAAALFGVTRWQRGT